MDKIKHIYIHWPFCNKKCSYCDFTSFAAHQQFVNQYFDALCSEITSVSQAKNLFGPIKTIFIGGGTPSLCPLPLLTKLVSLLKNSFELDLEEFTIEVNPGDISKTHLETYKSLGINRLSIGVQILDEEILQKVNRDQKNSSVIELLALAPKYFDNISIDLILGLPGTTNQIWQNTLNFAVKQQITHISVYFLTLYEKTPLYFKIHNKSMSVMNDEQMLQIHQKTVEFLAKSGFLQYEISNFAKPGFESTHNRAYWDRVPYMGFGLSAASFYDNKRFVNSHNLESYLSLKEKSSTEEILAPDQAFLEKLMLGLRQKKGMDLHRMIYCLNSRQKSIFEARLAKLIEKDLIKEKNGWISLTPGGVILENEVILYLIEKIFL